MKRAFLSERIRSVFLAMGSGSTFFFSQQCVAKLKKPRFSGQINSVIENAKKKEKTYENQIESVIVTVNKTAKFEKLLELEASCWHYFLLLQLLCACCSLLCFLFYTPSPFINTARHLHLQKMKISQRT
jgi:hypothetical protein